MLAQALACRLQQEGKTVEQLVLLDAYPSQQLTQRDRPSNRDILTLLLQATGQPLDKTIDKTKEWSVDRDATLAILRRGNLGSQLDHDQLNALFEVTRLNVELTRKAPIPERFKGDLTFITATAGRTDVALHHRAWQPFINGVIHNHDIEVDHGQLLSGNAIATIVQIVAALE